MPHVETVAKETVTFSASLVVPIVWLKVPSELITLYSAGTSSETSSSEDTNSTSGLLHSVPASIAAFTSSYNVFGIATFTLDGPKISVPSPFCSK